MNTDNLKAARKNPVKHKRKLPKESESDKVHIKTMKQVHESLTVKH